ncbi:Fe-S cluster protein [Candidatus Magnetomorum sp. HK-1]|nr:Fe-S cluster protein [Candidatus Magnetomorum sp. HK-1]
MLKTPMDILKLLKKNNCRDCNEKTCLAFAAAVHQGRRKLADCPHIAPEILKKYGAKVQQAASFDEGMKDTIDQLKSNLSKLDFNQTAHRIQGSFSDPWLTLKIFGKDFRMDTSGNFSSDIHITPWLVIPFLNHIIKSTGAPISGQWVTFRELKGGPSRLALYEQRFENELKRLADNFTDLFEDLIHIFNGRQLKSDQNVFTENTNVADIYLVLHPFPKIPILICYWKPEEDLDSDMTLFFDKTVHEQIDTESLYGLLSGILQMFVRLSMRHGLSTPMPSTTDQINE